MEGGLGQLVHFGIEEFVELSDCYGFLRAPVRRMVRRERGFELRTTRRTSLKVQLRLATAAALIGAPIRTGPGMRCMMRVSPNEEELC